MTHESTPDAPKRVRALVRRGQRGGPPIKITEAGLAMIEADASRGLSNTTIASRLGVDRNTLTAIIGRQPEVGEALARGRASLSDELTDILLGQARDGNVVAAIFLAKARCGWTETGPREAAQVNVQIVLPGPMTEAAYRQVIDVPAVPALPAAEEDVYDGD
jgi:hypothetical protein